jgi:hypothetical protein
VIGSEDIIDPNMSDTNFVSLRFDRSENAKSRTTELINRAVGGMEKAIDGDGILGEAVREIGIEVPSSILQATTPLIVPVSRSYDEALSDALERIFDEYAHFVVAYRVHTQDLAVDWLSRLSCVPLVPYVVRDEDFRGDESFARGTPGLYSVNDGESLREERFREIDESALLTTISNATYRYSIGDPTLVAEHELFRARRACFLHGDYQSAVVSAYSAIEVFFGAVLNLIHWEIGTSRDEVQGWFKDGGFMTRLRGRYHPVLGGTWNPNEPSAISYGIQALARLRGRVVSCRIRASGARGDRRAFSL